MKKGKKESSSNNGLKALIICGIITVIIITICLVFPDQFFGIFKK